MMTASRDWVASAGGPLRGTLQVPGDKSVSHRAVMLGALAEGVTEIHGFLEGEDTRATAAVFQQLGVRIEAPGPTDRVVHGVGLHGLRGSARPLDCGNAGTGMRLLAGVLAGQSFDSVLTGDASLSTRPMRRVTEPLGRMGARIDTDADGVPPLRIQGGAALQGIDYALPMASAQVKSALLLAGLYARGTTTIREPHPTRDYTERMLAAFGWPIESNPGFARLDGGHRLHATSIDVPADFSSAAFLEGEDTRATAAVFQQLGVRIEAPGPSDRVVHGVGLHGLRGSARPLDCGNAGTGMRLLAGLLAGQSFDSVLTGDASLSTRPMRRVTEPLARMGARIDTDANGVPPLRIQGGAALQGIDYALPMASAQVKSALLLAGLYARGTTTIREPHPTRDYTERILAAFGWPIESSPGFARIDGGHRLHATSIDVPADFSSAAFLLVAASVVPGSELRIEAVGVNPRRTGLLQALRLMGADIREERRRERDGDAVADLVVRHAPLHGIEVPETLVPDMIDEFPALFVAAACADGASVIRGAAELRVKESDRIATMAAGLRALGVSVLETADGAVIQGHGVNGVFGGGVVESHGDHRIAMSLAVAAQRAQGEVRIRDIANVATSFPGFEALASRAGMNLRPHL